MTRKLIKALREQKQQNKQVDLQIYGSLGVPLNGSKLVEVPNRNSYVYVRLRDNQNEVIQAFNNKVATSYGLPVIVHREGPRYVVDGVNTLRYNNNLNNFAAYLPKHGQVHSFFPGGGGDVVWTYSRQMMPLLVYPNSANTGTGVTLYSQPLLINNQWQLVGGTGTQDFSIYIPTGSNSVMGLIYLDASTGNPGVLINSGTPMSSSITGTGDVMPYVPVPNLATQIPLAAVKINTGTTTVGWDNLYDMREWVHAIPSGTSSGGGGSGTFVNIWDEGIFQGTVNTLNVVGSVADISVSGTVARLFITGSTGGGTVNPPITGSFVVQNSGFTLGSATVLNFTNGVSASISGSVAQIVVTGTATYVRTAPPISLSSVTGTYWQTQEQIFVSGSLALFNQGHALIPAIDYLEQYPSSGTFQYISTPPTGTYNLAIYGVPVAGGNLSGGGGGGSALTQTVNENGSSFTDFTGLGGTWSSDGTVIKQTNTGAAAHRAKLNTKQDTTYMIFEAEMQNRNAGTALSGILVSFDGSGGGGIVVYLRDDTDIIAVENDGVSLITTYSQTIVVNTWYKLRVIVSGNRFTIYLDGVLIGASIGGTTGINTPYIGLFSYGTESWFRNIKCWNITQPA